MKLTDKSAIFDDKVFLFSSSLQNAETPYQIQGSDERQ